MNWLVTIAGLVSAFTTVGHFLIGIKQFLKPMLEASFDPVPKKTMHCVFHYVSAFQILSTAALLAVGFGLLTGEGTSMLVRFMESSGWKPRRLRRGGKPVRRKAENGALVL